MTTKTTTTAALTRRQATDLHRELTRIGFVLAHKSTANGFTSRRLDLTGIASVVIFTEDATRFEAHIHWRKYTGTVAAQINRAIAHAEENIATKLRGTFQVSSLAVQRHGGGWAVLVNRMVIEDGFKTRHEADTRRDYLELDVLAAARRRQKGGQ